MSNTKFEGNFVESSDLMKSGAVSLKIKKVHGPNTIKAADGRLIDKPIIEFDGAGKSMIIGRTNERLIKAQHGGKASEWIGKEITIAVRYLREAFGERNVPTLRVILPSNIPSPYACRKHLGQEQPFTTGNRK